MQVLWDFARLAIRFLTGGMQVDVGRGIGGYRGGLGGVYVRSRERSGARGCQEGGYRDARREPWSVRALIDLVDPG